MRKPFNSFLLKVCVIAVAVFCLAQFLFSANPLSHVRKWFILLAYNPATFRMSSVKVAEYDMAILDPDHHPPIESFSKKTRLIAYVSLGEAEEYRSYWSKIKGASWIIGPNENWKGNYYVDVRDPAWRSVILREVIPPIVAKGFKGIFLDTLDTAEYLESKDPQKYSGSKTAMVSLVSEIHAAYPEILLISNNGFAILDAIGPLLSGMLVEDISMMPDFEKGGYKKVPAEDREYKTKILKPLSKKYRLPVFSIDYAPREDKAARQWCVQEAHKLGFKPYLAEKNLADVYDP